MLLGQNPNRHRCGVEQKVGPGPKQSHSFCLTEVREQEGIREPEHQKREDPDCQLDWLPVSEVKCCALDETRNTKSDEQGSGDTVRIRDSGRSVPDL